MTPNTIKSLLSASEYNPDSEEKESMNKSQQQQTEKDKNEKNEKNEKNKKSKLKPECAEFIPSKFLFKRGRQLSAIEEDQNEDEDQDEVVNHFSFGSQE